MAIDPVYCQPEICIFVNRMQSKAFHEDVGLRQSYVLLPLLYFKLHELF